MRALRAIFIIPIGMDLMREMLVAVWGATGILVVFVVVLVVLHVVVPVFVLVVVLIGLLFSGFF